MTPSQILLSLPLCHLKSLVVFRPELILIQYSLLVGNFSGPSLLSPIHPSVPLQSHAPLHPSIHPSVSFRRELGLRPELGVNSSSWSTGRVRKTGVPAELHRSVPTEDPPREEASWGGWGGACQVEAWQEGHPPGRQTACTEAKFQGAGHVQGVARGGQARLPTEAETTPREEPWS